MLRLATLLALVCSFAAAQDYPSARLVWDAPSECLAREPLEQAVSARLERQAFVESADAELSVHGTVVLQDDGHYRAQIDLATRAGEPLGTRELGSDTTDCRSLDDALAVMLAILLNVNREDLPQHPPSWAAHGRASAGLVVGLLPQPGIEVIAGGALVLIGTVGIELEVGYAWADAVRALEGAIAVNALGVRAIVSPILARTSDLELALRVGVGVGPMWGGASGFPITSTEVRVFLEGRAGLRGSVHVAGPLFAEIAADLGIVPLRSTFVAVNGDGSVTPLFEPSILLGSFVLGLSLRSG